MSKITLLQETCWLVRSEVTRNGVTHHDFWVVANQWNKSPAHATIFRSEEDAARQIADARYYDRAGFNIEYKIEPVPMHGALLTSGVQLGVADSERNLRGGAI